MADISINNIDPLAVRTDADRRGSDKSDEKAPRQKRKPNNSTDPDDTVNRPDDDQGVGARVDVQA